VAIQLSDDFSEATGTNLNGKALDAGAGDTWTVHNGSGDVNFAVARQTSGTYTDLVASADAGITDGDASVVLNVQADSFDAAGLIARLSNVNNYWFVEASPTRDFVRVVERVGGANTVRATQTVSLNSTTNYTLTVTVSGTSIAGTISGTTVSYGSMSTGGTNTRWGIYSNIAHTTFDDFLVQDAVAAVRWGAMDDPARSWRRGLTPRRRDELPFAPASPPPPPVLRAWFQADDSPRREREQVIPY